MNEMQRRSYLRDAVNPFLEAEEFDTAKFMRAYRVVHDLSTSKNNNNHEEWVHDQLVAMHRSCFDSSFSGCTGDETGEDIRRRCGLVSRFISRAKKAFMYLERYYIPRRSKEESRERRERWDVQVLRAFARENRKVIDRLIKRMLTDRAFCASFAGPMCSIGLLTDGEMARAKRHWAMALLVPHLTIVGVTEKVVGYI